MHTKKKKKISRRLQRLAGCQCTGSYSFVILYTLVVMLCLSRLLQYYTTYYSLKPKTLNTVKLSQTHKLFTFHSWTWTPPPPPCQKTCHHDHQYYQLFPKQIKSHAHNRRCLCHFPMSFLLKYEIQLPWPFSVWMRYGTIFCQG